MIRVHPRVCGGARRPLRAIPREQGPSPRVRGSQVGAGHAAAVIRSIPACAGEPHSRPAPLPHGQVHPRVCGGADFSTHYAWLTSGPSPRVRGSPLSRGARRGPAGSIPACAGEPVRPPPWLCLRAVHPRVCGGARIGLHSPRRARGPSPRVRGSRRAHRAEVVHYGSIPACAGEPSSNPAPQRRHEVHPRVCGGARGAMLRKALPTGPSPRVRGSPKGKINGVFRRRSIPACAGEPGGVRARPRRARVHPRVCGGADVAELQRLGDDGPSPRVRGSPRAPGETPVGDGSIPACAGEPPLGDTRVWADPVHPRVCGGAPTATFAAMAAEGPSPRVRGSPGNTVAETIAARSIPACAGEPDAMGMSAPDMRVHPRVCGGAFGPRSAPERRSGPSPRVAGEPTFLGKGPESQRVHPRVCGGAQLQAILRFSRTGPSPRVRGSPSRGGTTNCRTRSIPACAGEPRDARRRHIACRVHPRVCGGAASDGSGYNASLGPSPRVRGSPVRHSNHRSSIGVHPPACAGEPS